MNCVDNLYQVLNWMTLSKYWPVASMNGDFASFWHVASVNDDHYQVSSVNDDLYQVSSVNDDLYQMHSLRTVPSDSLTSTLSLFIIQYLALMPNLLAVLVLCPS